MVLNAQCRGQDWRYGFMNQVESRGGRVREWRGVRHYYPEELLQFKAGRVGREGILVCQGCHKKVPHIDWLKQ